MLYYVRTWSHQLRWHGAIRDGNNSPSAREFLPLVNPAMRGAMKTIPALAIIAAILIASKVNAQLILSIDEYTTNALTLTFSGAFDANTIGDSPGYLAVKNDWIRKAGSNTAMFSGSPIIDYNTVTIGGSSTPSASAQNGSSPWQDNIFFVNPLGDEVSIASGTVVAGSIRLTGTGMFDPNNVTNLCVLSGLARPFGPGLGDDWARLEGLEVPEPSATVLLIGGLSLVAAIFRRHK